MSERAMAGKRKPIPDFKDEAEERAYWESHDSTGHVDWSRAERARLPNLKPSAKPTSSQLLESLLE